VVGPIETACRYARGWLDGARHLVTAAHFGQCLYRHLYDIMAPPVAAGPVWAPPGFDSSESATEVDVDARTRGQHRVLYIGRLGKPYIEPPMSQLRFNMWAALRGRTDVTFYATDAESAIFPLLPRGDEPRKCHRCSFACKQCIALPESTRHLPRIAGQLGRRISTSEYRSYLRNATFCLIMRGDNEATKKFAESIVSGCLPVLIADLPRLPFDRRLDYSSISYEFDWRQASTYPNELVDYLLTRPLAEVTAKQRALMRVRRHFYFHALDRDGAVRQLIHDMCATVDAEKQSWRSSGDKELLYQKRLAISAPGSGFMKHVAAMKHAVKPGEPVSTIGLTVTRTSSSPATPVWLAVAVSWTVLFVIPVACVTVCRAW